MITLTPADYPAPSASMQLLTPANGELGDLWLDHETVAALHDAVDRGIFALDPAWEKALIDSDDAHLEALFLEKLRNTKLGPTAPTLHHRRLALFEAIRQVGVATSTPGIGFTVHTVSRMIGDLETWTLGKREELTGAGLEDDAVARQLQQLTADQLAILLQTSSATLSRWRSTNTGPAYAMLGQRTPRYPVIAVAEWLGTQLGGRR